MFAFHLRMEAEHCQYDIGGAEHRPHSRCAGPRAPSAHTGADDRRAPGAQAHPDYAVLAGWRESLNAYANSEIEQSSWPARYPSIFTEAGMP